MAAGHTGSRNLPPPPRRLPAPDAETLVTVMALGKRLQKTCILVGVCYGFVSNRMSLRYAHGAGDVAVQSTPRGAAAAGSVGGPSSFLPEPHPRPHSHSPSRMEGGDPLWPPRPSFFLERRNCSNLEVILLPTCPGSQRSLPEPSPPDGANQQTELLLEEGALPQDIDRAMRDFGFVVGPCQVRPNGGVTCSTPRTASGALPPRLFAAPTRHKVPWDRGTLVAPWSSDACSIWLCQRGDSRGAGRLHQ